MNTKIKKWKTCTLGELVTLQRGHDLVHAEFVNGKYPIAGSNGIIGYHDRFTTKGPGITIGRSGNIGTPYYYENDFWAHNTVLYIKEFHNCDPKYIYYLLKTFDFSVHNSGSAVPSLNRNYIHPLEVTVPSSMDEQKEISDVLSSLDDKIDLLHRQNKTLESLAETMFRKWFIEDAEDGWATGKIGDEFDFIMGQSPEGNELNETGDGMAFYQGRTDFGFRFPETRIYTTAPTRIAEQYDTLVSVRAPVGDMNMASEKCCLGRGVAAFRYKRNTEYFSYTYYKLRSLMKEIQEFNHTGTVFGSISKGDFEKLEITIPNPKLIDKFQDSAKQLDLRINLNSEEIKNCTKLRDSLLNKLINGEVQISS